MIKSATRNASLAGFDATRAAEPKSASKAYGIIGLPSAVVITGICNFLASVITASAAPRTPWPTYNTGRDAV